MAAKPRIIITTPFCAVPPIGLIPHQQEANGRRDSNDGKPCKSARMPPSPCSIFFCLLIAFVSFAPSGSAQSPNIFRRTAKPGPPFNGKGSYRFSNIFLQSKDESRPCNVLPVEKGVIHVSGMDFWGGRESVNPEGIRGITTFRTDFKWANKTYLWNRVGKARELGISLYHNHRRNPAPAPNGVWARVS